jgi:hypothetical protein
MTPSSPLTFLASTAVIAPALAVGADGDDGSVDAGSVRA